MLVRPSYLTEQRRVIPKTLAGNVFLVDRAGNTSNSISFKTKPSRFNMKSKFPDDMLKIFCQAVDSQQNPAWVAGVRQLKYKTNMCM